MNANSQTHSSTSRPRVVVAGGSGFLGQNVTAALVEAGYAVTLLSRRSCGESEHVRWRQWDNKTVDQWANDVDGAVALINVVGRSVDCRKTPQQRRDILESRLDSVRVLGEAMRDCAHPPPVWVQAGSAHIVGDPIPEDTWCDDHTEPGTGFAPDVCVQWERAFNEALLADQRGVIFRMSFVMGVSGGALSRLMTLVRWGLGGRIASGRQYISWIHEEDVNRLFVDAVRDDRYRGAYMVTSPNPATNAEFMAAMRRVWRRPWSPPVPTIMARLGARFVMRTDPELALYGRRCAPKRLVDELGFEFRWPDLEPALRDLRQRS